MLTSLMPVLPGEVLAQKYRIEKLLGQGGMGVVVAAHHIDLDVLVAIKFLSIANTGASVDRFLREARAAAKVRSEHVCQVFDVGRLESGEPYIVMEHLEGVDLGEKIANEGPQSLAHVASWMIQVCDAVGEAHQRGIVHRDLKPANVFLVDRSDGSFMAKVLDFGISKLPTARGGTTAQGIVGSPLYMAPEQIESASKVDSRADIWSMGVMLYELLSGELPFGGESILSLAMNIREGRYVRLRERQQHLPTAIDEIVAKCLHTDPTSRYACTAELASALAPFAESDSRGLAERIARRENVSSPNLEAVALTERAPNITPDPSPSEKNVSEHAPSSPRVTPSKAQIAIGDKRTPASDQRGFEATEAAASNDAMELSPPSEARRKPSSRIVAAGLVAVALAMTVFLVHRSTRAPRETPSPAPVVTAARTAEPTTPSTSSARESTANTAPAPTAPPSASAIATQAVARVSPRPTPAPKGTSSAPAPAVSTAAPLVTTTVATSSQPLGPRKRVELDRNDPL
jgi:eukaryotic-like serine/threonine-protein kinase